MVSDISQMSLEEISEYRGSVTRRVQQIFLVAKISVAAASVRPGRDSPFRDRPEEESLELEDLKIGPTQHGFCPKPRYPRLDSSSSFRIV